MISVVHSLETQVCDPQAKRFEAEASKIKDAVVHAIINMDLAFAQARYYGAHNSDQLCKEVKNVQKNLSSIRRL
jgi:thiol peroxidase